MFSNPKGELFALSHSALFSALSLVIAQKGLFSILSCRAVVVCALEIVSLRQVKMGRASLAVSFVGGAFLAFRKTWICLLK